MIKESNELINSNIKKITDGEWSKFQKELRALMSNYVPYNNEAYTNDKALHHPFNVITREFCDKLESPVKEALIKRKENDLGNLLNKLNEYLDRGNY